MRAYKRNNSKNLAVSEIFGTIIMLGIATTSFSSLSYYVLSTPAPNPAPIVEISGAIDDNQVIITHCGGEPLDLNTEVVLTVGGISKRYIVGDFLDSEATEDGVWGLGEKFVYPLGYDFDYLVYPNIDINIVEKVSNSLLLTGLTKVNPTCDIGVEIAVDNLFPKEFENVEISLTVTNFGNINASSIYINFSLPKRLTYFSSTLDSDVGSYNISSGILYINRIPKEESYTFKIIATVGDVIYDEHTQLVLLLDGSGSITPNSWKLILKGITAAVRDESRFPHSGVIELTIIQFGGKINPFARLEIGPIVITELNIDTVIDDILNIKQIGDKTPTSCAVKMAADILEDSERFEPGMRQVILLVTDGNPTHSCDCKDDDYIDNKDMSIGPKDVLVEAIKYLVNKLELNENNDEIDCLAVDLFGEGHNIEMLNNVVWPKPGYYFPDQYSDDSPSSGGGWVRNVSSWEEFADSINESFEIIFNSFQIFIKIQSSAFSDPKTANDIAIVVLNPKPTFF